jgi:long-chain acyl-CoA synthetase
MAHSFGKVLLTTQLPSGFPTAVDGRVERIVDNLAVIKPTFMGAAPRIFEKAYGRVVTMAHNEGGAKAKIFDWACAVGKQAAS